MKYTTIKENTYNTIPKQAIGNVFNRLNRKHHNSTNKEDHSNPQIGCQYLNDRYLENIIQDNIGEQAPSI